MRARAVAAGLAAVLALLVTGCGASDDVMVADPCTTDIPVVLSEPAEKGLTRGERTKLAARVVDADTVREPSVTAQTVSMVLLRGEACSSVVEEIHGTIDPQLETADYELRKVTDFRGERLDVDTTTNILIVDGTVGYDKPGDAAGYEKTDETVESLKPNPFGTIDWSLLLGGATAVHRVDHEPGPHGDVTYLVTVPWEVLNKANVTLREGWGTPAGSLLSPKMRKQTVTVSLTVEPDGRPVAYSMVVDATDLAGPPTDGRYLVATSVEWDHYGVRAIRPAPAW